MGRQISHLTSKLLELHWCSFLTLDVLAWSWDRNQWISHADHRTDGSAPICRLFLIFLFGICIMIVGAVIAECCSFGVVLGP